MSGDASESAVLGAMIEFLHHHPAMCVLLADRHRGLTEGVCGPLKTSHRSRTHRHDAD
jgi:hypothetical protein